MESKSVLKREAVQKGQPMPQDTTVSESPSVTGLGADADYAYKDIEEFEEIVGYKVNNVFRDGWRMARSTNKQLRALAGEETGT